MDQVLERSADAGVTHIFLPAIDFNTSAELKNLSHPRITFYPMAGIHPGSVEKEHPIDFEKLLLLCEDPDVVGVGRSEEHTSELQSRGHLVCRLLLEKKINKKQNLKNIQ